MESIRNFLKSWPGRIFLILCLSPLALLGIESYHQGANDPNQIAVVGDESITLNEYQNAVNNMRSEVLEEGVDASLLNEEVLHNQVLQNLIDRALLQQQTAKLGMTVSDETITRLLQQDTQFHENGQFSNDRFAYFLQRNNMTMEQLFARYRQQLNILQLNASIVGTAIYPMAAINELIDLQEETRHVWVYRYPWQDFADKVNISDSDIEAYYKEHQNELNSLAMVDLAYLALSPESMTVDAVTDEDIQAQYAAFRQRHQDVKNGDVDSRQISQILLTGDDAQSRIQNLRKQIEQGESFSEMAKKHSEDVSSAKNGGNIGTFNADIFGDDAVAVEQAINGLAVGEVSQPVKTAYGYQLFMVTKDDVPSLEEVKDQMIADALLYKKQAAFADKVTRINDLAADGYGIEDIAQQEGMTVQTIKDYSQTENDSVLNQPAVIKAAFDEFTIQDQAVSPDIKVGDSTVWVQPSNYRPIAPLSLQQATAQIKDELLQKRAGNLALQQAQKLATQVQNSGINAANVQFLDLGQVTRQSPMLFSDEKAITFSEDTPEGELKALAHETSSGASVLVVDSIVKHSKPQMSDIQKQQTARLVRDNRGQAQMQDYIEYLRTVIKVEKNESAIESANAL